MRLLGFRRFFFAFCALCALTSPLTARADGLRAKDMLGITSGMSVEDVDAKIQAYNHDMIIQHINTQPTAEIPSYTNVVQGDIPPDTAGEPPRDEITVHFVLYSDGSVRSDAIAHFAYPLPEDQRISFQSFVDKVIVKYGPASTLNEAGTNEARWVFNGKGLQILDSWGADVADYKRCSGIIPYITNSGTRAGLPIYAMNDCGDFLYVRLFPADSEHLNTLAGYYMMYVDQEQYLRNITGIDLTAHRKHDGRSSIKDDTSPKKIETTESPKNSAGPKF